MPSEPETRYQGQYSSGKTARSFDVEAVLGQTGIDIVDEQGRPMENWPYDKVTSVQPLQAGLAAQLSHKDFPDARLYVQRGDFTTALLSHLPHLSAHVANRRLIVPLVSIGLALLSMILVIWFSGLSISQAIARLMPDRLRDSFGEQVVASIGAGKKACDARAGREAFAKLVGRLEGAAGHDRKFTVQVVPMPMMNAFAAPGERIVVSKKLVDFVGSPEELAGVIAHEMGHGIKMHPEAGIVRALGISAAIGILFGNSTGTLGEVGAFLLQLKYSRSAESEADAEALAILRRAKIPARPFASFFERLEKRQGRDRSRKVTRRGGKRDGEEKEDKSAVETDEENGSNVGSGSSDALRTAFDLLSTHPPSPERIKVITSQPDWPSQRILSDEEWKALRNICK